MSARRKGIVLHLSTLEVEGLLEAVPRGIVDLRNAGAIDQDEHYLALADAAGRALEKVEAARPRGESP